MRVSPETFALVSFDAESIERLVTDVVAKIGLAGHDVRVEVDETTPLARIAASIENGTIVVRADSGAFEDTRRPLELSAASTSLAAGRALLRARDRLSGRFDDAPADRELDRPRAAAWDAWSVGRLARLGVPVHLPRWRYNFRNRHGFTDAADRAFDRLWDTDVLSWGELVAISDEAIADRDAGAG